MVLSHWMMWTMSMNRNLKGYQLDATLKGMMFSYLVLVQSEELQ